MFGGDVEADEPNDGSDKKLSDLQGFTSSWQIAGCHRAKLRLFCMVLLRSSRVAMLIQKTVAKDGSKAFSLILCKLNLTRKEPETKVREAKLAKAKFTGKHANKGREVQHLPRFDLGKLCP